MRRPELSILGVDLISSLEAINHSFIQNVLQCGLVAKPGSNKSRSADGLWARWVPGCIWPRPQAESVVRRIWPGFLSLMRAEAHMRFVPDGYQVYLVEAAGRERSHPPGEPEGRAVCVLVRAP